MSEQSHYSIGRNVKIMGLGEDSIINPVTSEDDLKRLIQRITEIGKDLQK